MNHNGVCKTALATPGLLICVVFEGINVKHMEQDKSPRDTQSLNLCE